jgi:GT2 family glycosyltransferase
MTDSPDLSIVIVSWNVSADLEECLASIEAASPPANGVEVIVVDNASSDDSVDMLRSFPTVRVLVNSENLGFSAANNQGIGQAQGRYVLVLNPDTVIEAETLVLCLSHMDANPDVGLLGCKVIRPDGTIQPECARNFPTLRDSLLDSFYLHMIFPKSRMFGTSLMTYWDHADSRDVPCIVGAFMLLRREVLREVGLFDTSVPMYLDDIDLCYRISRSRWRTYYLSTARIVHKGGRSEAKAGRVLDGLGAQARYAFFLKHFGWPTALAYRMIIFVRGLFRCVAAVGACLAQLLVGPRGALPKVAQGKRPIALLKWSLTNRQSNTAR